MTEQVFDGQTVLITGAAGGFGQSASQLFAERGARLVLSDFNADGLAEQVDLLRSDGVEVASLAGSVAEESHCRETVELAMKSFGRLDIAINNAGMSHDPAKTADVDSDQAQMTIQVDLMGVFFGMKHQIPVMQEAYKSHNRTSSILNVASLAGIGGAPTMSMYAAAKHGVVGLTKSAALEYAQQGIRVNAVAPAGIETDMLDRFAGEEGSDMRAGLTAMHPVGRLGKADEIADAVLYLASDASSFITGTSLKVDGGFLAQ